MQESAKLKVKNQKSNDFDRQNYLFNICKHTLNL